VKTEKSSACVKVKCKVYGNIGSAVLPAVPSCMYDVSINTVIQSKTLLVSHSPLIVKVYMFSWNKPIFKKKITYNLREDEKLLER
jgi:hypothetical protein